MILDASYMKCFTTECITKVLCELILFYFKLFPAKVLLMYTYSGRIKAVAVIVFTRIAPDSYVELWQIYATALTILLSTELSPHDLQKAEQLLQEFVSKYTAGIIQFIF
jgi:hypothetical protein